VKKLLILMALVTFLAVTSVSAYADLTIDNKTWVSLGNKRMLVFHVDFDSSYLSYGESLDWAELGFINVLSIKASPGSSLTPSNTHYTFEYDYTNKVLRAFAAGIEPTGRPRSDLSNLIDVRVEIIGN